jgi:hypothetical protein
MGGVLLAPMLSLERLAKNPVNRILRPVSSLLNWLMPTAQIVEVAHNTKFPELQEKFDIGASSMRRPRYPPFPPKTPFLPSVDHEAAFLLISGLSARPSCMGRKAPAKNREDA